MPEVEPTGQRGCRDTGSGRGMREHIVAPSSGRYLVKDRVRVRGRCTGEGGKCRIFHTEQPFRQNAGQM